MILWYWNLVVVSHLLGPGDNVDMITRLLEKHVYKRKPQQLMSIGLLLLIFSKPALWKFMEQSPKMRRWKIPESLTLKKILNWDFSLDH
jgi:hypothetical protein